MSSRRRTASVARERLQQLSRAAYTATAGHLEVEPDAFPEEPARRRWSLAPRLAWSAVVAVLALAVVVGARALAFGGSAEPVPVVSAAGWSSARDALGAGEGRERADGERGAVPDQDPRVDVSDEGGPAQDGAEVEPGGPAERPMIVHVAGNVGAPGVVELAPGSRVHQALDAAGGPTPSADLAAVNLARLVVDGEQIYVPAPGERPPGATSTTSSEQAIVDLNTATADQLDALPGIGPVLAGRIVDWRTEHGRFTVVEELGEVSGIGPAVLERLRDRVRV